MEKFHGFFCLEESKRNKKLVEEHFEGIESDGEGSDLEADESVDGSDDEDGGMPGTRGAGGSEPAPSFSRDANGRGKIGSLRTLPCWTCIRRSNALFCLQCFRIGLEAGSP
jgi:hypothetical protein